jgi:hypothetical protein
MASTSQTHPISIFDNIDIEEANLRVFLLMAIQKHHQTLKWILCRDYYFHSPKLIKLYGHLTIAIQVLGIFCAKQWWGYNFI